MLPIFADTPARLRYNHPKGLYAKFKSSSTRPEKLFEVTVCSILVRDTQNKPRT